MALGIYKTFSTTVGTTAIFVHGLMLQREKGFGQSRFYSYVSGFLTAQARRITNHFQHVLINIYLFMCPFSVAVKEQNSLYVLINGSIVK